MGRRVRRLTTVIGVLGLCLVMSCGVGGAGISVSSRNGTVAVSITLAGTTRTWLFGRDPVRVPVQANARTTPTAVGFRLMDEEPADRPTGASMVLRSSAVGCGQLLTAKEVVHASGIPPSGTATVTFSIASGQSAALCDSATLMATYDLTVTGGAVAVAQEVYELSQQALAVVLTREVTICIEILADFDGELSFSSFSLSFEGGPLNTASFALTNSDSENIHILLPEDVYDDSNHVYPGYMVERELSGVEVGASITVRAGRGGVLPYSVVCPTVLGRNYTAYVEWDGVSLTCDAEQLYTGPVATGPEFQVPIDANGDAVPPTDNFNGIDYAYVGALYVSSAAENVPALPSNVTQTLARVNVDLAESGLQYVERVYFSSQGAWVPDLPNGITVATLTCDYLEGGSPTVVDFTLGSTTAEWSYDRPDHDIELGGVSHSIIPILFSVETVSRLGYTYDGHAYAVDAAMDPARTLSSLTLELGDVATFAANRTSTSAGPPEWAGQTLAAITLVGPPGTPHTGGGGGGTGTVAGRVVDAQTGGSLAGAVVEVSGTTLSTTTDASGNFVLTGVSEGTPTLVTSLSGYVETSTTVVLLASATLETSIGMLALGAGGDNVAAILAWGENPRDLDLHMSGPDGSGGRFHAYYDDKTPVSHVDLDLDDTESYGPETMTIRPGQDDYYVAGDYHVWVHHFAGLETLGTSSATITLFAEGTQIAQYRVGGASGDSSEPIWQVVEFTVSAAGTVSNVDVVQSFTDGDQRTEF